MNTVQTINLIATNPDIRNGRAYILGTTVTVADIALTKHYHGQDAGRCCYPTQTTSYRSRDCPRFRCTGR